MFLRAFMEIRVPSHAAAAILRRLPIALMQSFASEAIDHGHTVLAEVGFPLGMGRADKEDEIELGDTVETPSRTWISFSWRATRAGGIFPSLDGELEAAPLGRDLTQIGLSARYKPPFGFVGSTLDRMFLHRVAEATVQDFIRRIAVVIEDASIGSTHAAAS